MLSTVSGVLLKADVLGRVAALGREQREAMLDTFETSSTPACSWWLSKRSRVPQIADAHIRNLHSLTKTIVVIVSVDVFSLIGRLRIFRFYRSCFFLNYSKILVSKDWVSFVLCYSVAIWERIKFSISLFCLLRGQSSRGNILILCLMNRVSPEWHGIKAIFVDFVRRKAEWGTIPMCEKSTLPHRLFAHCFCHR